MRRLPVFETIRSAIEIIWQKRVALAKALLITAVVQSSVQVISGDFLDRKEWLPQIATLLLQGVVFVVFAVICHRLVLLGEGSVPRFGLYSWSGRETRFLGWSIVTSFYFLIATVPILMGLVAVLVYGVPHPKAWKESLESIFYIFWLLVLPGTYFSSRVLILLPATAIDERHDTDWAWELTKGNGWRLVVVVGVLPALLGQFSQLPFWGNSAILDFAGYLVGCVLTVIEIAALSLSFRFLAGNIESAEDAAS